MARADVARLRETVAVLTRRPDVVASIGRLKSQLHERSEAFVWANVDLNDVSVPTEIRSAWIFVLKAERWSGAHFHPNSIQHMNVLEGEAYCKVGDDLRTLSKSGWIVIDAGVPHEFYPIGIDMVVMSFHTAMPSELLEVSAGHNSIRRYSH